MDFKEYLLKRNKNGKEKLLTALIYLVAIILALFVFLILLPFAGLLGGMSMLLSVAIIFIAHKICARFKKEYEYIITDDLLDIDVIFNASARKRLISFSLKKDAKILAAVSNEEKNAVLNEQFDNVIDATTNSENANVYFVVVEKDDRTLVKFEPPYAALEIFKKHAPSKVFISE